MHLGDKALGLGSHHFNRHRLDIGQADRLAVVLGVNHHLVGRVADVGVDGVPKELHLRLQAIGRLGGEDGRTHRHLERRARSRQGDVVAIGVGGGDDEVELFARHEAILVVAIDVRHAVAACRDEDLHVTDDGANLHAMAPFLDDERHVVFALQHGILPAQVARDGVDFEGLRGLGIAIPGNLHAIHALAGQQAVAQAVTIGIVGRGIVDKQLAHAGLVDRRVEQLHRIVVAHKRVDDQFRLDIHRHRHRVGHIDHAVVAVGVLHADDIGAWGSVVMGLTISVLDAVIAHVRPCDARDKFRCAVAPEHQQGVALFPCGVRDVVGRQRNLVGIAAHPCIGDLCRTLVRRLGGEGKAEQESYDEQKFTLHCTTN